MACWNSSFFSGGQIPLVMDAPGKQRGKGGNRLDPKLKTILSEIGSRFGSFYGKRLLNILLYGSHSRGEADPGSDIDILVVLRGPVDPGREISATGEMVSELSLRFGEVISCVFIDEDQFLHRNGPLLRNVRREGIPI
jgi:predicted nucleotidyltransferase